MTNSEKIKRFREIYAEFMATLDTLKAKADEQAAKKLKAREKAEIDELLSKISKDY